MDRSRLWSDLPQDIVGLIINKLCFYDQICALAVCKSWHDCKSYVRSSETLPWVVHHDVSSDSSFICEVLNPCTRKLHIVRNSLNTSPFLFTDALASKQGWLLFYGSWIGEALLLYNPFTNDARWITQQARSLDMKATFNVDPISHECEVFMLDTRANHLRIDTYKASSQTTEFIVEMNISVKFHSVLYMKGMIYCLSKSGKLYSYSLEDKSLTILTSKHPVEPSAANNIRKWWLLDVNEDLVMVFVELVERVCKQIMIFRFDWGEMSWVVETGLKSCAIYISGHIAFCAPLQNRSGEKLEGCRVYYLDKDIKCYSMSEAGFDKIQCEEYGWISNVSSNEWSFIETPDLIF